jgi:hypothetical protein
MRLGFQPQLDHQLCSSLHSCLRRPCQTSETLSATLSHIATSQSSREQNQVAVRPQRMFNCLPYPHLLIYFPPSSTIPKSTTPRRSQSQDSTNNIVEKSRSGAKATRPKKGSKHADVIDRLDFTGVGPSTSPSLNLAISPLFLWHSVPSRWPLRCLCPLSQQVHHQGTHEHLGNHTSGPQAGYHRRSISSLPHRSLHRGTPRAS